MEQFGPIELILAALIMFLSSTIFSALGFGIGLVAIPFLLLIVDPQTSILLLNSIALMVVILVAVNNRSYIKVRETIPMGIAGLVGAIIGAFVLKSLDGQFLSIIMLILIIGLTIATIFNIDIPYPDWRAVWPAIGFMVAFLITAVGTGGGPMLALFLIYKGWQRHSIRASMALFFIFMGVAGTAGYVVTGLYTVERFVIFLAAVIPSLLGYWLGNRIAHAMNDRIFRYAVIVMILATSLIALAREVTQA